MKLLPLMLLPCVSALIGAAPGMAEPATADESRLGHLEAVVQAQEAVRAVKRLQNTYSHYLDAGLWDDLAGLCTDSVSGVFEDATVTGKEALRRYVMQRAGRDQPGLAPGQLNIHLILQPIITLGDDGRTAKGAWHEIDMLGKFGTSASWAGGIYENEYVLDRGVWKISVVHFYPQYAGSYDAFGHKAPAKWNIPYHFEAAHVGVTIPAAVLQGSVAAPQGMTPATHLAELSRRVQRLKDEVQVQNLQHAYGYYLDRKMWDDVTDLFADDGSLELAQRGVYVGKAHIRHALDVLFGPSPLRTGELFDHVNLATVVTIAPDGRSAGARTSQLSMLGLNGEYANWEVGTYENEFIKQAGVWKLKAVHYYPRMTTNYDLGWARDARPAPGPARDFAPDHPPTQAFASYPKLQTVGFHYANPVTHQPVRYPGAATRATSVRQSLRGAPLLSSAAGEPADIADVERELARAIGFDATENLNSSYGYYIDESAWDQMSDTYAADGTKELTGVGVYVGPERIRKALNLRGPRGGRTPGFFTIHQLTQPVIDVSQDGMSAKGRFRLFQGGGNADGSSASWIGGIYENTAEMEHGEWKFGRQELYHIFNSSYRNGWARVGGASHLKSEAGADNPREQRGGGITQGLGGASGPSSIASQFPADRPIRVRQYAFPDIVEPPFHYANPVTGRMPPELLP